MTDILPFYQFVDGVVSCTMHRAVSTRITGNCRLCGGRLEHRQQLLSQFVPQFTQFCGFLFLLQLNLSAQQQMYAIQL